MRWPPFSRAEENTVGLRPLAATSSYFRNDQKPGPAASSLHTTGVLRRRSANSACGKPSAKMSGSPRRTGALGRAAVVMGNDSGRRMATISKIPVEPDAGRDRRRQRDVGAEVLLQDAGRVELVGQVLAVDRDAQLPRIVEVARMRTVHLVRRLLGL